MAEIEIKKLEEMRKILARTPPNKIVFWLGAGMDSGQPTCSPLGNNLTDYILQLTCGNKTSKLIEVWKNNCKLIKSVVDEELEMSDRPRLETIIEAVREFEDHQIKKKSVVKGLFSFSSKNFHYNSEHFILAQFLHRGANIVTTNYGDFICKAYEEEYGVGEIVHEYKEMHLYRSKNEWGSGIYHIHGISSDLETIGANLTTVKNSLPEFFKKVFAHWLEMGCVFVFMGYSGLDSLDVNPFLQSFCNEKHTMGIYVRHVTEQNIMPITRKEKILLNAFEEKVVCPCLTKDFFSVFLNSETIKVTVPVNVKSDWKRVFEQYAAKYSEEYSDAFISGLCYRLGIPITKILDPNRWLKDVTRSNDIDIWYRNYYSFENAVIIGQKRILKKQGMQLLKKDDELMKNDYETAVGNLVKVIDPPDEEMLRSIKAKLSLKQQIDWSVSTKLKRYMEYSLFEKLRGIILHSKDKRAALQRDSIVIAMESLGLIIEGSYDSIIHVHQITTAYRSLAICQRLVGLNVENSMRNIDIALHSYADLSSINGVALTTLYKAIILLLDYYDTENSESLKSAVYTLKIARRLLYECGLKKYYKRFAFSFMFYMYVRMGKRWCLKASKR